MKVRPVAKVEPSPKFAACCGERGCEKVRSVARICPLANVGPIADFFVCGLCVSVVLFFVWCAVGDSPKFGLKNLCVCSTYRPLCTPTGLP